MSLLPMPIDRNEQAFRQARNASLMVEMRCGKPSACDWEHQIPPEYAKQLARGYFRSWSLDPNG